MMRYARTPTNKLRLLPIAILADFALLTAATPHVAWMRVVTARLESRCHISIGVVYNTLPMPLGIGSDPSVCWAAAACRCSTPHRAP